MHESKFIWKLCCDVKLLTFLFLQQKKWLKDDLLFCGIYAWWLHKILGDYKFFSNSINSSDFLSQILERQPHTEDRSCSRMLWPSNSVNREVSTHTLTHTDTYVTHERIWGPIWFLKWNDSFLLDSVGLRLYPLRYSSICIDR